MPNKTNDKPGARWGWVKLTPVEAKAFSNESKQEIKRKLDDTIECFMKPSVLQPVRGKPAFGTVREIYTKWRGNSLVVFEKRAGGVLMGKHVEDFETKSGRITLVGVDRFDVAYFRHTERWWTIAYDCSLKEALAFFRKPSPVWPW